MLRRLLIGLVLEVACAATAAADTVSLPPRKDNTIYSERQYTNGGGQYLFVGNTVNNDYRRTIISFDVASAVPAGSTIESANLTLHTSRSNPTGAQPVIVHLHRCLAPWGEGTVVATRGEGFGGPPGPGDATWNFNAFGSSSWATPGGDHASSSSGSTLVLTALDFYTWSSSPGIVADVQSWLDSPQANFGWVVISEQEAARVITAKRFDSRENIQPAFRPVLQIVYRPPVLTDGGTDGGRPDGGCNSGCCNPGCDAGVGDAGVGDAGADAGRSDAGNDAGRGDPGVADPASSLPDRTISEVGAGCQAAPGSFLAIAALALLALRRLPRYSGPAGHCPRGNVSCERPSGEVLIFSTRGSAARSPAARAGRCRRPRSRP